MIVRAVVVVALLAGCVGSRDGKRGREGERPPSPAPATTRDAPVTPVATPACAAGQLGSDTGCVPALAAEQVDALAQQAARLAAVGERLAGAEVLGRAADVLTTFHGLATWRRDAALDPSFAIVDHAPALRAAPAQLAALATQFTDGAHQLQALHDLLAAISRTPGAHTVADVRAEISTRLAATFAPLGASVTTTIRDTISPLVSPLVDEVMVLNQHVCLRPDATTRRPCADSAVVSAAAAYLEQARQRARQDFDDVGGQLEQRLGDLIDGAARTAIDRAIGRGPGPGEPCGADDLCASSLSCRQATGAPTRTCERGCSQAAMQPCPAGLRCQAIAGLGDVCRR